MLNGIVFVIILSLMRNLLTISLITIHLLGNTELAQVLSLSKLSTHYQQHHKKNPSINVFDFLVMHYAGDDNDNSDNKEDMQLPFKKINIHCYSVTTTQPPVEEYLIYNFSHKVSQFNTRVVNNLYPAHTSLPLQPPRI